MLWRSKETCPHLHGSPRVRSFWTLSGRHRNAVGVFRLIIFGTPTRVWTCHVTICDYHAAFGFCKLAKAPKLLGTMPARRTGKEQEKDRNSSPSHGDFFQLWWFLIVICPPGPNFFQQTVASNICMPGAIWFMAMHTISFCMGYSQIAQLYM